MSKGKWKPKEETQPVDAVFIPEKVEPPYYLVFECDKLDELQTTINHQNKNGYKCQGGVSVASWLDVNGQEFLYSQAMIHE